MEKITDLEIARYITTPITLAKGESSLLTPVVGAGVSVPIGAPTWNELCQRLSEAFGLQKHNAESSAQFIQRIYDRASKSAYEKQIISLLSLPEDRTSLTLQALITSRASVIVTTNLDYSVERAFEMSGRTLRHEDVIIGKRELKQVNLNVAKSNVTLIKLHGSLEKPESWVVRENEYNSAYLDPGEISGWWKSSSSKPLFIGFSFSDEDISHILRLVEYSDKKGGYAILPLSMVREIEPKMKRYGIMPIAVESFQQIPDVIDEIYRCSPIKIELRSDFGNLGRRVIVGAAEVNLQHLDVDFADQVIKTLANAVDFHSPNTGFNNLPGRNYGQRGLYLDTVVNWLKNKDTDQNEQKLKVFLTGLIKYPDVFFGQLLPSIFRQPGIMWELLKTLFEIDDRILRKQLTAFILDTLENPGNLTHRALRNLAKFCSKVIGEHPAMKMPPVLVALPAGDLSVTKYPLTRFQVGILKNDNSLKETNPVVPYTLENRAEIQSILEMLNDLYGNAGNWRLPTDTEWKSFISLTSGRFPWGDTDPQREEHAHLRYRNGGGSIMNRPVEVGTFRQDILGGPLRDLIGNVYEAVINANGEMFLAGGSYTSSFESSKTSRFNLITSWGHGFRNNVGLRPVFEHH